MPRHFILTILCAAVLAAIACAEPPAARFIWGVGQTIDYRVEQLTTVNDSAGDKTDINTTKMNLSKRWHVQSVDAAGVATLQLSLLALRMEMGKAGAEPVVFDSQKVDPANAELNKELLQYIGKPIAILRIDGLGRLVDVSESRFGPASRFVCELPFRITLPGTSLLAGQAWQRTYQIKLEPPQGAGEVYNAEQKYTCKEVTPTAVVIGMATAINDPPEAMGERIPLVPLVPGGTIVFDPVNGRMKRADLKMNAEFVNHRGEGSKYRFTSTYHEELVEK